MLNADADCISVENRGQM